MKTALTFAILGALAATPALAQGMQQGNDSVDQPYQLQGQNQPQGASQHQAINRDSVRNLQQALNGKGYQIGQADGVLGPRTRQALRQFQKDQGIQANGQIDQQTLAALGVESTTQQAQTPEGGRNQNMQHQPSNPAPQANPGNANPDNNQANPDENQDNGMSH